MRNAFALLGDLCYCPVESREPVSSRYVVCEDGRVSGVFERLPTRFEGIEITDYSGMLILPGFTDLHLHAPQYPNCGLGGDLELLDWLQAYTYPEEARYADLDYARGAYTQFARALLGSATTRACIFATCHSEGSLLLGDLLERTGLKTLVGRVSMDRNSPDSLRERGAATALAEERAWLKAVSARGWHNTAPILTPRFVPACSEELLRGLGRLQAESGLAVQSHLDENPSEIEWVRELVPDAPHYAGAYDRFGLFGGGYPAIMAHCVHCSDEELALIGARGVTIAHCPTSNTNLKSGVAPVRRMLDLRLSIGLGSDISGGHTLSMLSVAAAAVADSKLRWRLSEPALAPLSFGEAFWLATVGGGAFFGQVGSFSPGFEFDAVVLDDSRLRIQRPLSPIQRTQRLFALTDGHELCAKYVAGERVLPQ